MGSRTGAGVANLPDSWGKRFATLDEYLEHLRCHAGPIDKPWYREVRPGVYVLQTGNLRVLGGNAPKSTFTREQLERKFGFRK